MIVLNSIFPVFGLILLGVLIKKIRVTSEAFLLTSDRLIYYVFFPLMLFWEIGGKSTHGIDWPFCLSCIAAVVFVYLISLVLIKIFKISDYKAGTFSQSCIRFNSYIGIAIVLNAAGKDGVSIFGILIGFVIPIINILSVTTLIWFSGKSYSAKDKNKMLIKALISNPLILGCIAGILYANTINFFPTFIDNTFKLASSITLPLALLSIGGSLTLAGFKEHFSQSVLSSITKLVLLPAAGYVFMKLFNVAGISFFIGMIFFAMPTSSVIYVLSSQLNSDVELAYASIVVSTILSVFSLTAVLTWFQ